MRPEQHLHIVQLCQLLVVDGDETHLFQTITFLTVMDDITQTVEGLALGQFLFCLSDGGGHTKTEATAVVNFYLYHDLRVEK